MVENRAQTVGPQIGVERRERAFRADFVSALSARTCVGWQPGQRPVDVDALDLIIVEGATGAEDVLAHWPGATLLRWGRPQEPPSAISWDGWIDRSLRAPDAADVLIELLDAGLLGRFHGPTPAS